MLHTVTTKGTRVPSLDYLSETCWIHKISYKFPNYGIQKILLVLKQFLKLGYLLLETLCFPKFFAFCSVCPSHSRDINALNGSPDVAATSPPPFSNRPSVPRETFCLSVAHCYGRCCLAAYDRNSDCHIVVPSEIWTIQTNVGPAVDSKTRSGTQTSCWAHPSSTGHYHPQ